MKNYMLMIAFLLYAVSTSAECRTANYDDLSSCPMIDQSQVNINFNSRYSDLNQIKELMDNKIKEVEAMAKQAGIEKIVLQSMNYNIYANDRNAYTDIVDEENKRIYQLNGNISFNIEPADNALELMEMLINKGYFGGLNVNKYRRCN